MKILQQVKGKTASLKINVTPETAGRYLCKATVDGFPEIEAESNVFIKSESLIYIASCLFYAHFIKES